MSGFLSLYSVAAAIKISGSEEINIKGFLVIEATFSIAPKKIFLSPDLFLIQIASNSSICPTLSYFKSFTFFTISSTFAESASSSTDTAKAF